MVADHAQGVAEPAHEVRLHERILVDRPQRGIALEHSSPLDESATCRLQRTIEGSLISGAGQRGQLEIRISVEQRGQAIADVCQSRFVKSGQLAPQLLDLAGGGFSRPLPNVRGRGRAAKQRFEAGGTAIAGCAPPPPAGLSSSSGSSSISVFPPGITTLSLRNSQALVGAEELASQLEDLRRLAGASSSRKTSTLPFSGSGMARPHVSRRLLKSPVCFSARKSFSGLPFLDNNSTLASGALVSTPKPKLSSLPVLLHHLDHLVEVVLLEQLAFVLLFLLLAVARTRPSCILALASSRRLDSALIEA